MTRMNWSHSSRFDLSRIAVETFAKGVEYHDVLGSTNDRAIELVPSEELQTPHVVLANQQSAGRGRGANVWWSAPGSLMFSVIVDTASHQIPAERISLVSLAAGLAVSETLTEVLPGAALQLKWPNDVFLNGRKASGLLVEVPSTKSDRLVIGIGINVNNSLADASEELQNSATSLVDVSGSPHDRTDVLIRVLQRLEASLALLAEDGPRLLGNWRAYCLLTGRTVLLRVGTRESLGLCRGIDEQGAILLETTTGLRRFSSGVVVRFD
jgi:BirA family biotin operon repressor/biotin-[acetyl-CoA-carboxylase] ligase